MKNKVWKSAFTAMADMYYGIYFIDIGSDTLLEYVADNKKYRYAGIRVKDMIKNIVSDGYLERGIEFADITTLQGRMKGKKSIYADLQGKTIGWFRISFIAVGFDEYGVLREAVCTIQIIDEYKRREQSLIYKSVTDELTGCYNRRAYEEDLLKYDNKEYIYVSMDVNGLKTVNDTFGHEAGDELIKGASNCMCKIFGSYGKVYRTGGDEFAAVLCDCGENPETIREAFHKEIKKWSGNIIKSLTISCGYVHKSEFPDMSVTEIAQIADRRMYEEKSCYYEKCGVDGHCNMDIYKSLDIFFDKIIKINLDDDTYKIIKDGSEEHSRYGSMSQWIKAVIKGNIIHPDDLDNFIFHADKEYLKHHFLLTRKSVRVYYRKTVNGRYENTVMEILPVEDYSVNNRQVFLYVKINM